MCCEAVGLDYMIVIIAETVYMMTAFTACTTGI